MMKNQQVNRRDFLKLLALTALTELGIQGLSVVAQSLDNDKNTVLPNIIIVVFDALSGKHISTYGYHRETTPNLSRFAEKATVFHHHYSTGNFTMPGTSSLLTGTYPWTHGGYHLYGSVREEIRDKNIFGLLASQYYTIAFTRNPIARGILNQFGQYIDQFPDVAEHSIVSATYSDRIFSRDTNVSFLAEMNVRGYSQEKAASPFVSSVINQWESIRMKRETEKLREKFPRGLPTNLNGQYFILEDAIAWMVTMVNSAPKPFFGYFHLFPPHFPYRTRREFNGIFDDDWQPIAKPPHFFTEGHSNEFLANERRFYDEYIAYADAEFGRFISELSEKGLLDNTYIIFTSDHGEMFERGIFKHLTPTLYEPIAKIPLLLHQPKQSVRVDISTITSSIDVIPTLLYGSGQPIPDWCEGQVLPVFDKKSIESNDRSIYIVEAKQNAKGSPLSVATLSSIKDGYKIIHYRGYEGLENNFELYDLENDPEELKDIYASQPGLAKEMQEGLEQKLFEVNQKISG